MLVLHEIASDDPIAFVESKQNNGEKHFAIQHANAGNVKSITVEPRFAHALWTFSIAFPVSLAFIDRVRDEKSAIADNNVFDNEATSAFQNAHGHCIRQRIGIIDCVCW